MRRTSLLLLVPALLVCGVVGATVWRLFRVIDLSPTAPEIALHHEAYGGSRFEFEHRPGSEAFEVSKTAHGLFVRRGDEVFEFRHGIPIVNGTTFPSPGEGGWVRWNLDGPLLIGNEPVVRHPFQPRTPIPLPTELVWQIKNPSDAPRDSLTAAWARNEQVLVTAHGDGVVRVWDVVKGTVRTEITPPAPADGRKRWGFKASVSPNGKLVAAANVQASAVTVWEADTGKLVATFDDPPGKVTDVRFVYDGMFLEARAGVLQARMLGRDRWKGDDRGAVHTGLPPAFAIPDVSSATATNDGQRIVVERGEHAVVPRTVIAARATAESPFALDRVAHVLALADGGNLSLYETTGGTELRKLWWRARPDGVVMPVNCLTFFADRKTLAVGAADGLHLYDVESGRERGWVQTLSIRSLAVSGDGAFLAATTEHGPAVLLWEVAKLQPQ